MIKTLLYLHDQYNTYMLILIIYKIIRQIILFMEVAFNAKSLYIIPLPPIAKLIYLHIKI